MIRVIVTAITRSEISIVVGNSGIARTFTESTEVEGTTGSGFPACESSASNVKPVVPVLVTLNVTVAIVPLPLNEGVVEPVEVASK